jgi:hypothetical protein
MRKSLEMHNVPGPSSGFGTSVQCDAIRAAKELNIWAGCGVDAVQPEITATLASNMPFARVRIRQTIRNK